MPIELRILISSGRLTRWMSFIHQICHNKLFFLHFIVYTRVLMLMLSLTLAQLCLISTPLQGYFDDSASEDGDCSATPSPASSAFSRSLHGGQGSAGSVVGSLYSSDSFHQCSTGSINSVATGRRVMWRVGVWASLIVCYVVLCVTISNSEFVILCEFHHPTAK